MVAFCGWLISCLCVLNWYSETVVVVVDIVVVVIVAVVVVIVTVDCCGHRRCRRS